MMPSVVKTTCPYCGVGCGVDAIVDESGKVQVRGTADHPANLGKLCSKGSALAETISFEDRLTHPQLYGSQATWDDALSSIADRLKKIIERHGPDSVAFYVSGQLLTEDYYVANKLMKGFIGSANIDTNSRLCMSSSVAGHKRAFGSDTVPCNYEDLEIADLVILTGSNTAWCHPVLYQRLVKAKRERANTNNPMKIIVIDPRETATCDIADLHLPLNPGSDTMLFNGLLNWLNQQQVIDKEFVSKHTEGHEQALKNAAWHTPTAAITAAHCGLEPEAVETFFHWFAKTEKTISVYSQGVNQSSSGTDKVNAIINCHLLTGRIGKPGMGPFSFTGQPNAMGGREVGALANQMAAHMDFDGEDIDRLQRFWQGERMATRPGLKAVDLFRQVEKGTVKAVWIMATNPAVSLPDNSQVRRALDKCELVIVSDCVNTDTTDFADVILPIQTWGEKQGTVTNSERRISRQRKFIEPPEGTRTDWHVISEVAQRMGFTGFDYQSTHEIFSEYCELTGFENDNSRDLDLSGLKDLSAEHYDQLKPVQWPVKKAEAGTSHMFTDQRFFTGSGRAQFVAISPRAPANLPDDKYPFRLNTGRIRDQWHTMTRTGRSPRLSAHTVEPYVEINPHDALYLTIEPGDLVSVNSQWGKVIARANISDHIKPGDVFIPFHWSGKFASQALADSLVNPATDPVSGQPEFKHTPVAVSRYTPQWHGFLLSRKRISLINTSYWCCTKRYGLWQYEIAGEDLPENWASAAREMLCGPEQNKNWSEMFDSAAKQYRGARFVDGNLAACLFISASPDLPARDWLIDLFAEETLTREQRLRVLAGTPAQNDQDRGKIICSCHSVGFNTIKQAITEQQADSVEKIGEITCAGTNCGSCVPELQSILEETLVTR